jgi:LmbE family N-acetylglucosaminyl deacetylase
MSRQRQRRLLVSGTVVMCLVMPLGFSELKLYQRNLAVAREPFPLAPSLRATDRLLVLVPHCDDETLGVGSTIQMARARGIAVCVVFLTNGDGSRSTQIAEDVRRLRLNSFSQLARLRQREAIAALSELGVARRDVIFLGYPDGGTGIMWQRHWSADNPYKSPYTGSDHSPYDNSYTPGAAYCGTQVLHDVTSVIEEFRPTVVFTTHPSDTHPDHWAAYAYTRAALESLRLRPNAQAWARGIQFLTFLVHRGLWPAPHGYHPDASLSPPAALMGIGTRWVQMPLDARARAAKKAALARYASQTVFTPHYLRGFLRRNELFGIVPAATSAAASAMSPERDAVRTINLERSASLLRDPTRDSPLHDVWPAADVKAVSIGAKENPDMLNLRVRLAKPLSPRLRYRLSLHVVTAEATSAWLIEAWRQGPTLRAVVEPSVTISEVPVRLASNGFIVQLPRRALGLIPEPCTLLISGSTYLGGSQLDQTETGTLRFVGPASSGLASTLRQVRKPVAYSPRVFTN